MKYILFCYKENKKLVIRKTLLTDVVVPIEDVISPQKTTITLPKTNEIELNDIVIIKDNNSGIIEYIGYVDTVVNKSKTEVSCYPLINVFDNDYVLDQMCGSRKNADGSIVNTSVDVVVWLENQLTRAFLDTEDYLQALPLVIRNKTNSPVLHKKVIDTSNLLEVYTELFIETGVYVVFSELLYNKNEIEAIYCDIYSNKEEKAYPLYYNSPSIQKFDIIDNTFTNCNKIIATEELAEEVVGLREPQRYFFYLLNDNSVTTNPNDKRRIKQVRSKEITFSLEDTTTDTVNSLMLAVYNELQAPEYNLQITIDMLKNDHIKLHRRVDFVSDKTYNDNGNIRNVTYSSNVTKIEKLNDKQVRVTLGALRNSLTDFKKKVEAI